MGGGWGGDYSLVRNKLFKYALKKQNKIWQKSFIPFFFVVTDGQRNK